MIVASLAEVISISSIIPFLAVLTSPEQLFKHDLMQPVVSLLGAELPEHLLLPLTLAFVLAAICSGIIRLLLLYATTRLSYAIGADLSIDIYRRTLYQEYSVHVSRNSSEVINSIIVKTNTVIGSILNPILVLVSSIILLLGILTILFKINAAVAFLASAGFGIAYWIVIAYTAKRLKVNSQCIANESTQMIKSLQEGLGGIRDILIDGSQKFYCKLYRNADLSFRRASGDNQFINGSPRYIMEAIGIVLIATLAYFLSVHEEGIITAIPTLGALALGAQRLLPVLQQSYSSYTNINGGSASLSDVVELLDQSVLMKLEDKFSYAPVEFKKEIEFKNLGFRYSENLPYVVKGINLKIKKGSKVGFVGATGSGKSTLLDIFMGLLPITEGEVLVDQSSITFLNNRSWQLHISHVPQHIFLADSSIEKNIAFGIPQSDIDRDRVRIAAEKAQMSQLIEQWPDGYQTIVGEQGIRLSGGQRQRIGIARALYKQADILILDEATSALDNETESKVMEAINKLDNDLTVLIIAHRLTTLKECDQIVSLGKDYAFSVGRYQDIIHD